MLTADMIEQMNSAMAISSIDRRLHALRARLRSFDRVQALTALGALLTVPRFHVNTIRVEVLAHLAMLHCEGDATPTAVHLREWLNHMVGADPVVLMEDPPEDVFVSNVVSGDGNALLFEGVWEANGGHVQGCLKALEGCRRDGHDWAEHCSRQATALLRMSTEVARRSGLRRHADSGGHPRTAMVFSTNELTDLSARVRFTAEELHGIGVHPFDLAPFVFQPSQLPAIASETISWTSLERRPVLKTDDGWILALPTAPGAAIRRRVIESAIANDAELRLAHHLTEHQLGWSVALGMLGLGLGAVTPATSCGTGRLTELTCRFDVGAYAHVILVQDDLRELGTHGFRSILDADDQVRRLSERRGTEIAARGDFRLGMTMVVFGGQGRGMSAAMGALPDGWLHFGLGCEDLELFGQDTDTSAVGVHRLLRHRRETQQGGSPIANMNGLLNLHCYAATNDFMLLPEEATPGEHGVLVGSDHVAALRSRLRRTLDRHVVQRRRHQVEVQRLATAALFENALEELSYVSIADVLQGRHLAVVELPSGNWWITIEAPTSARPGSLPYRVFDMARNWLAATGRELRGALSGLGARTLEVALAFPHPDPDHDELLEDLPPEPPEVEVEGGLIRITCDVAYLRSFTRPENVGDRWMVEAVTRGAMSIAGADVSGLPQAVASRVIADPNARHLHVLRSRTTTAAVLATVPIASPRFVQEDVRGYASSGLAHRAGHPVGSATELEGPDAITFLNAVVETLWRESRTRLEELDRACTIARCLGNIDAVEADREQWRHTAASVLHMHEREAALRAATGRESQRAETGLCSRVVAEMAVCACPLTGGRAPSLDDLDRLVANVAILTAIAGRSDEIRHGWSRSVLVRPNGVLRFEEAFTADVQKPFLSATSRGQFVSAANAYPTFYDDPRPLDDEEYSRLRDAAFDEAFVREYGLDPLQMIDFVSALALCALEENASTLSLPRSSLIDLAVEQAEVSRSSAEALVANWSLLPRARWDDPSPEGASPRDWFPWRFARRLSLMSRPIVQLSHERDPPCLISVPLAQQALAYALRAHSGLLPDSYFRTKEMKSWVGGVVDRLGHEFNHEVARRLATLGLSTKAECLMTELGGVAADGDVDVLAWHQASGTVHVVECKRLLGDRTTGEIAERLAEYRPNNVDPNGRRGPARKHLDRFDKLRSDRTRLAGLTGIHADRMRLSSCLVTSALVPMQFQVEMGDHFDVVAAFDDLVKHFGSSPGP